MARAKFWTDDRLATLLAMKERGEPWERISAHFGRSVARCEVTLCRYRKRLGIAKKQPAAWSKEEDDLLIRLYEIEEKPMLEVCAIISGRTLCACFSRMDHLRGSRRTKYNRNPTIHIKTPRADEAAIAAREARYRALDLRSLTAARMGDPPPGYSALDQKRRDAATP
jgi:hypothetical protein